MRDRDGARNRSALEGGGAVIAALLLVLGAACDGPTRTDRDSGGGGEDGGENPGTDAGGDSGGGPTTDAGRDAGDPLVAPIFRNAVDLPDDELARQALALMGAPEAGGSGSCSECHAITRQNVRRFWDISDTAWRTCFADLAVESEAAAQSIVDCFQEDGGLYSTSNLGVFATGANFDWFRFVFRRALGTGWEEEYERFPHARGAAARLAHGAHAGGVRSPDRVVPPRDALGGERAPVARRARRVHGLRRRVGRGPGGRGRGERLVGAQPRGGDPHVRLRGRHGPASPASRASRA
ncbi:MAG: hypothetical protein M5U28_50905 [Sandaracinaceae bacterium]|nr:hypothetical protein [Sandaracinaceae bacterium]